MGGLLFQDDLAFSASAARAVAAAAMEALVGFMQSCCWFEGCHMVVAARFVSDWRRQLCCQMPRCTYRPCSAAATAAWPVSASVRFVVRVCLNGQQIPLRARILHLSMVSFQKQMQHGQHAKYL